MNWDMETDLLCVGSGAGGMAAAIVAAEQGARALVVEKDNVVGGVTGLSSGQCWLGGSHLEEAAGLDDSREETLRYLEHLSQGHAEPHLREVFVDKGREVIEYLTETIGLRLQVVRDLPDYYYPAVEGSRAEGRYLEIEPFPAGELGDWAARCMVTPYGEGYAYVTSNEFNAMKMGRGEPVWDCLARHLERDERCAGAGLMAAMVKAALDRGVEILTESPATRLIHENGKVTGAIVATPEGEKRVKARGVVLATSGYDWNRKMVSSFEALPESGTMCPPTVEGDHLVMAAELGAIPLPSRAPAQTPVFIGYKVPGETVYGHTSFRMWLPGHPHSMIVNRSGSRFCDDSFYPDVATKVGRFDGQEDGMVNWPAWLVFDENFREKYGILPAFPGEPVPEGMATTAGSIEELARLTGIDADGLAATVARFNGFCATGIDEDFGRGTVPWGRLMTGDPRMGENQNLGPLEKPPYYAVRLERVVMGVPTAGLEVDDKARVINVQGEPIPGLFAAGNAATWRDIGGGYNSGIANTRGLVQGYLAARHVAG